GQAAPPEQLVLEVSRWLPDPVALRIDLVAQFDRIPLPVLAQDVGFVGGLVLETSTPLLVRQLGAILVLFDARGQADGPLVLLPGLQCEHLPDTRSQSFCRHPAPEVQSILPTGLDVYLEVPTWPGLVVARRQVPVPNEQDLV